MLYQRGEVWWYKFRFAGRLFRESAKTTSKTIARQAERKRHQSLEEGVNGIKKRVAPITFAVAASEWLKLKKPTLAPKSHRIEQVNVDKHLKPEFGSLLLLDITADDIAAYQKTRLKEKASPKTINLEVGTLRAILRRHRLWANLQPDVKMLTFGMMSAGRCRLTRKPRCWRRVERRGHARWRLSSRSPSIRVCGVARSRVCAGAKSTSSVSSS